MSITLLEDHEVRCARCRAVARVPVWLAIDLVERPDLRAMLTTKRAYEMTCPACGHVGERRVPMFVTRLDDAAPALVAHPGDVLVPVEMVERVEEAVRQCPEPIPWPMVDVSFSALRVAAGRSVGEDVHHPDAATEDIAGDHPEVRDEYKAFLGRLNATAAARAVDLALAKLHRVVTEDELRRLLSDHPELLDDVVRKHLLRLRDAVSIAEQRLFVDAELDLLSAWGSGETHRAWSRYEEALMATMEVSILPVLRELTVRFDAVADDDPETKAELGEQLVRLAQEGRQHDLAALASLVTGIAHGRIRDDDRRVRLERAIQLLEFADDHLERHPEVGTIDDRHQARAHLAAALGERTSFDPAGNQSRAIDIGLKLLAELTMDDDGDLWAKTHTHLGGSKLALALAGGERGKVANLEEILAHHREALRWRSFDRDPLDWAYTQFHLGHAHAEGGGSLVAAREYYENAVRGFKAAGHAAGLASAREGHTSVTISLVQDETTPLAMRRELLSEAEVRIRSGIASKPKDAATAGALWWQLSRVLATTSDPASLEVRRALREALRYWTPESAPARCRRVAHTLAISARSAGAHEEAADAWDIATTAAAAAVDVRAIRAGRLEEIHAGAAIFRSAGYALAAAGRLERAVEVVESGRAREVAAWLDRDLIDIDALRHVDPAICERFLEVRQMIDTLEAQGADPANVDMARSAEALADAIAQIRALPGHAAFMSRPTIDDLAQDAPEGQTIAYPIITPAGSLWLLLQPGAPYVVSTIELDLDWATVWALLARTEQGESAGYLPAHRDVDLLDAEIAALSAVLGPRLMEPLASHLADTAVDHVCLVPLGLLGLLPLHALEWQSDSNTKCLLDHAVVSYAPSAYSRFLCQRRLAQAAGVKKLVAVGNPLPATDELDHAEAEAGLVAATLEAPISVVLLRHEPTRQALIAELSDATHVHLACHGAAAITTDAFDSAIFLARGDQLSAADIVRLDLRSAQVLVVSACESAVLGSLQAADEALAVSTAFIGAGAASVVASMWEVDDYATALLMTRFYEELAVDPGLPARALQRATLWLRDLERDDELRFVDERPTLRRQHDAFVARRGRRGTDTRQFSEPTLWAAFTVNGA